MSDQESIAVLESLVPPKITQNDETKENESQSSGKADNLLDVQSLGCPFTSGPSLSSVRHKSGNKNGNRMFVEWQTSISIASEPIVYHDYLGLDKILSAQYPVSKKYGTMAHDEHLFIIVHQSNIFMTIF